MSSFRKRSLTVFYTFSAILYIRTGFAQKSPSEYVDLFIGTAGDHGQLDPAASVPFGMVKPGPDTDPINHSGYDYLATKVIGFSINRIGGTGCKGAGGNLRIRPALSKDDSSFAIDKTTEKASPGYYTITFSDSKIKAEITATNSLAWQRFTFPKSGEVWIHVNVNSSFEKLVNSTWKKSSSRSLSGYFEAGNVCNKGKYKQFYNLTFDREIVDIQPENGILKLKFQTDSVLNVQTSISPISSEYASEQAKIELQNLTFAQIREAAAKEWDSYLSKVKLKGKEESKTLFYTFLYRSLLTPVKTSGSDGKYQGTNGKVHTLKTEQYNGWSMWDTYRNKFPLISFLYPEKHKAFAFSIIRMYKEGKKDWATDNEPVPTVRTEHSQLVLLDAYQKGLLSKTDLEEVFPYLVTEADSILQKSPDQKLEAACDFRSISVIAGIIGNKKEETRFLARSAEYQSIYKTKFAQMDKWSDIMHGDGLYEGTRWQYRWALPFDVPQMLELLGGKEKFTQQLEQFFDSSLYSAGNEPDIHVPYLFNYSSKPWLTQKWLNRIQNQEFDNRYGTHAKWKKPVIRKIFQATPEGLIPEMDDDDGTMAAWYVWSSMGLYPVRILEQVYEIGLPLFEEIEIKLPGGKTFQIKTKGLSEKSFYIKKLTLNGQPYNSRQIEAGLILKGGKLEIEYGEE